MLESQHILQRFLFFLQFMKNPWKKYEKIFKKTLVFPTRTYYNGGTILALAGYIISRRKTYEKEAEAGIGHKNGNTAQTSAFFADYRLPKVFKFLFALKNTADNKHKITSNRKNLFYNSWLT